MLLRAPTAAFCAVSAMVIAALLLTGLSSRDIVHIYARSTVMDYFQVLESGQKPVSNNYFPRVSGEGTVPVSFPVSSHADQFRIYPGDRPTTVAIVRVCLERSLFINHCVDGASIAGSIDPADGEQLHNAAISVNGRELIVNGTAPGPYFRVSPNVIALLRPASDLPLRFVQMCLALATAAFFFCFFYSWMAPLLGWWNLAAACALLGAGAIRGAFFAAYQGGFASDSLLFENYLHVHIFVLPGIRGIFYPAFLSLFPLRSTALFAAQSLLGAIGAVIVLELLHSIKRPSRWDILWAVLATSVPTLLAMELVDLSESLSLFLVLVSLMAFRGLQLNKTGVAGVAGLGACCALLYHTKPQFGFTIVLFALAILLTRLRSLPSFAAFCAPVLAMQLLVTVVNSSAGNFRGVTSTLGYSLFDHAQQFLTCPSSDPEPRIQYFCRARAETGTNGNPTGYTAWVIFPSMHGLQELFHQTTAGYASLSFHLIATHPVSYAISVSRSFIDFWIDDVPMAAGVITGPSKKTLLPLDLYLRRAIEVAFALSLVGLLLRRSRQDGDRSVFCFVMLSTVFGSAAVQALAESGNEQARFAVPTMPLLLLVTVYLAGIIRDYSSKKVFAGLVKK